MTIYIKSQAGNAKKAKKTPDARPGAELGGRVAHRQLKQYNLCSLPYQENSCNIPVTEFAPIVGLMGSYGVSIPHKTVEAA